MIVAAPAFSSKGRLSKSRASKIELTVTREGFIYKDKE